MSDSAVQKNPYGYIGILAAGAKARADAGKEFDIEQQARYEKNYADALKETNDALVKTVRQTDAARLAAITFDEQGLRRMTDDEAALVLATQKANEQLERMRTTLKKMAEDGADLFSKMFDGLTDNGFKNFLRTVLQDIKDFFKNIAQEFVKGQLQQFFTHALLPRTDAGAVGAGSATAGGPLGAIGMLQQARHPGGGGVFGALAGLAGMFKFGSSGAGGSNGLVVPSNSGMLNPSIVGYADGGHYGYGKPRVVGERGPEIDVPRHSGTVVPMNKISGGGDTHHYHLNISMPQGWSGDRHTAEQSLRAALAEASNAHARSVSNSG